MKARYSIMFFLLSGAGACAYFGVLESELSSRSSAEPEQITLQKLITRGPNGNPNVRLTDFEIAGEYAVERKMTGKWTKVWVPIVPLGQATDDGPQNIHALLFSDQVANAQQVYERFAQPQLRGLIDPESARPSILASAAWGKRFPNMDLNKCLIIVVGKEPAGIIKLILLWGGCVLLTALAIGVWAFARYLDTIQLPDDNATRPAEDRSTSAG